MKQSVILLFLIPMLFSSCVDNPSGSNNKKQCKDFDLQAQQDFLEGNAMNPFVTETESGLQYRVIEEGDGDKPTENSTVKVEHEGRLIDGTIFDATQQGQPIELAVNKFIEGFKEGLLLMKEGATYELVIPADLAYGDDGVIGTKADVCPGATVIFEVTLVEIL